MSRFSDVECIYLYGCILNSNKQRILSLIFIFSIGTHNGIKDVAEERRRGGSEANRSSWVSVKYKVSWISIKVSFQWRIIWSDANRVILPGMKRGKRGNEHFRGSGLGRGLTNSKRSSRLTPSKNSSPPGSVLGNNKSSLVRSQKFRKVNS